MTIVYRYGKTYYINMTNRCPCRCVFCVRNSTDALGDAECLWLDREPTPQEILDDLESRDLSETREIVFCGYGEPTERLEDLLATAKLIKERLGKDVRLDTNGLGDLINGRDIVPELAECVDRVSISLNASNAEEYLEITRSRFGIGSYDAVLRFIEKCRESIGGVTVSIVGGYIPPESEEECSRIAKRMGVAFRIRRSRRPRSRSCV
ncbi:MAG: TatD family nuclease-associated radical SAM protein [Candidatus Methanomethylophilaceae archaeon]|nr:TatD family nuclease-associated radical SAM protein [Candidatus Methanomethylophilaceae archaeon]